MVWRPNTSGLVRTSKQLLKRGLRAAYRGQPGGPPPIPPEHWGLERRADGHLTLQGIALHDLASRFGSPLHVVNAARLRDNARRYLSASSGKAPCEVYYSYKTNPVPGVLQELHRQGIGAEVISHYELWLARKLGVAPDRIVYNGPVKSEASLIEAIKDRIQLININHLEELPVIARIARELGIKPRVGLRITVGGGWSGQFGTPTADGAALRAYREAMATGVLDVVGLHAHRGGMVRTEEEVRGFLTQALAFVSDLRRELGLELEVLNFGGSLAVPSVRGLSDEEKHQNLRFSRPFKPPQPERSLAIERYLAIITELVAAHYDAAGSQRAARIFVEPGRSVTSDAQLLLTRVQSTKSGGEREYAILDAGINLAESATTEYHQWFVANHVRKAPSRCYALAGPICTPGDTLQWAQWLPEVQSGDTLVVMDAGAYFVPFSTSFSFPRPAIVMLDDGSAKILRRAESFDDLVNLDDLSQG